MDFLRRSEYGKFTEKIFLNGVAPLWTIIGNSVLLKLMLQLKRTPEEKLRLLKLFERRRIEVGRSVSEAAEDVGVPLSTLYRWQAQADALRKSVVSKGVSEVSAAISKLVDGSTSGEDLLEPLFLFVCWLRWPTMPNLWSQGVIACMSAYLADKHGNLLVSELSPPSRDRLCRALRLRSLALSCTCDYDDTPMFELYNIDGQHFNEQDACAELAKYFINWAGERGSAKPSFAKAYRDLHDWSLSSSRWKISFTSYRKFFREHFAASPFLYIERYFPSLEWTIEMTYDGFCEQVDEIISDRTGRKIFFVRSFAALQAVARRLNVQAGASVAFPSCPSSIDQAELDLAKREIIALK